MTHESAEAKNLKAISLAIDQHNHNCKRGPAVAVEMCAFEVDRLGWDSIRGLPIEASDKLGSGRFRIVCEADLPTAERDQVERTEAVGV